MIYVNFKHLCDFIKALLTRNRKRERGEGGNRGEMGEEAKAVSVWKRTACSRSLCWAPARSLPEEAATIAVHSSLSSLCLGTANFLQKCPCRNPIHLREINKSRERERVQGRVSLRERLVLCKMYWLCARRLLCWCAGLLKAEQRAAGRTLERPQMCTGHNFYSGLPQLSGGLYLPAYTASALLLTANPRDSLPHGILYSY